MGAVPQSYESLSLGYSLQLDSNKTVLYSTLLLDWLLIIYGNKKKILTQHILCTTLSI